MYKLFFTGHSRYTDGALLILRVAIGCMMLTHGLPKVSMLFNGPVKFFPVMGMSPTISLAITLFAQVFCSVLVLLGAATRLALVPLLITMLVAVLIIHHDEPFVKMEPALHFLLVYVVLLMTGPGTFSVDQLFIKKKRLG